MKSDFQGGSSISFENRPRGARLLFLHLRQRMLLQQPRNKSLIPHERLSHLPDILRPEFFLEGFARILAKLAEPRNRGRRRNCESVPAHEVQNISDDVLRTVFTASDDDAAGFVLKLRLSGC